MTVQEGFFSQNKSSLFVGEEHVPVLPVDPGILEAVSNVSAGVALGTAVPHVSAAHRIRRWTAAPFSWRCLAAGLSVWTSGSFITLDVSFVRGKEQGLMLEQMHRC